MSRIVIVKFVLFLPYCAVLVNAVASCLSSLTFSLLGPFLLFLLHYSPSGASVILGSDSSVPNSEPSRQAHCIKYETDHLAVVTVDTRWDSEFRALLHIRSIWQTFQTMDQFETFN
jgi:hypothetical protein